MVSEITDGKMINSGDDFATAINQMRNEAHGLLSINVFTVDDAISILLTSIIAGRANPTEVMLFVEGDRFLLGLEKNHPLCSGNNCDNPMHTIKDVGVMVIVHGLCDLPHTVLASGICKSCWEGKFTEDRDQAMAGFLDWLAKAIPGLQTVSSEANMKGNAPTTAAVN